MSTLKLKARFGGGKGSSEPTTANVNELLEPKLPPALEPKVMAPYVTRPGDTPRRVQIERKKRLYAAQNVPALVEAEVREAHKGSVALHSGLELSLFDDTEFDSRTSEEWTSPDAVLLGITALALVDGSWKPCKVLEHKPVNTFLVELLSGQRLWLPRIDICFTSEDPALFAKRRGAAEALRIKAENMLRYNLFVDSMPTEDIPPLTVEQINRMLGFALNSKRLKDKLMDTSQLINEINIDYARTMNRIVFDELTKKRMSAKSVNIVHFDGEVFKDVPTITNLQMGTVSVPWYDFLEQFSEFSFNTSLTKPEVITASVKVLTECNKVLKMNLFNLYFTKSMKLEDFEQAQKQASDQVATQLKESWVTTLRNAVKTSFKDAGKGWFNLHESNHEIHNHSKLKRFLTMTRFRMEDTLRFLVEESLSRFVKFMEKNCDMDVKILSTNEVVAVSQHADYISSKKSPLFALELVMNSGHFEYSTPLESFEPTLRRIFEHALTCVQTIPQLEPSVMESLMWTHIATISSVHKNEANVCALDNQLASIINEALKSVKMYLSMYKSFEPLLQLNVSTYIADLEAREDLNINILMNEIKKHTADLDDIRENIPHSINVGVFQISCRKVFDTLRSKKESMLDKVKQLVTDFPRKTCEKITERFKELNKALLVKSTDPEMVKAQRDLIETVPKVTSELYELYEASLPYYDALEVIQCSLSDADVDMKREAQFWPIKIQHTIEIVERGLQEDQQKYKQEQKDAQESFEHHLADLNNTIKTLSQYTDLSAVDQVAKNMVKLEKELKDALQTSQLYNSRESLFGEPQTDYSQIKRMIEAFDPFQQFWITAASWKKWQKSWMFDRFDTLDAEQVEKDVAQAYKVMYKMGRNFTLKELPICAKNCDIIRVEVEAFRKYCPLINALRSPGMRPRHWDKMSADIGIDVHPDSEFTLNKAIEMKLPDHIEAITKVSDVAGKEYSIETTLNKMQSDWENVELLVMDYRETGTYIIKVEEQITQQLDDHIVMTQAMSFSPFKKPFEERIALWEQQLSLASETLDEWVMLQRTWMYLEPIFSSDDIMQQLPLEGKRFSAVDRTWRKAAGAAKSTPHVLTVCNSKKQLESFIDSNKMLDSVQKGLADYLETKRLAFARFFFLSNDELLQILSQTKNALAVQPHLRKCFEAINSLDFEDDLKITAMNSVEKEKVPFCEYMYPKGNVEIWLGEVERIMRASVRQCMDESLVDYVKVGRKAWVKNWAAMVILAVDCIYWTKESEEAIQAGQLQQFYDQNVNQLLDLTDLVRGPLTGQERMTIGALIVIDVHARDVVQRLMEGKVTACTDFDWVAQLRYYWYDRDEGKPNVWVKMVQATLPYGYEYLGNSPRLVVTPLTDRCYMTLMGAMHLNLGGAPAGPAGTGKTETTKDLAKALAMQCVVFNCSDGLDYMAMAKFFKGLASSGAWACFDEFNRIDLEVLSVVAQQILTIQIAVQQKLTRFVFEESEINLDKRCTVFITMNPGYAGRSELPDNLKALFRPCAMMVPDYALIAEISLMSFGFRNGRPLSRKMVATFKLCSEQLSSQDHYDYGMRAVKSVITAAGNLKRDYPDENEEVLLLRGLSDVNVPKFLAQDLPLFSGIISDLFPGVSKPDVDYNDFLIALKEACDELLIQSVDAFNQKVIQLYEMTLVRHGMMLVGPTGGGKTCCYRSLQKTMSKLKAKNIGIFEKVKVVALNPKSITMGQLYGDFDEATHEWTDGVLACYMRGLAEDTKADKKWLMFDGPVDAIWIENMNTVLDDNKKLCLVSGEIIALSATMTMMFEVEDLAVASPATVSRCGMIYMEPTSLGLDPFFISWAHSLKPTFQPYITQFKEVYDCLLPGLEGCLFFIRKVLKEVVSTVDTNLILSMFNVMDSLMKRYIRGEGEEPLTEEDIASAHQAALPLFIFSFIWSIGATVTAPGRVKLEELVREKLSKTAYIEHMPPSEHSMYDYCYDQDELRWKDWMETVPAYSPSPDTPFSAIIVPTSDTVRYTYLIDRLLNADKHVLCVGETGTGKTLNVMNKLANHMPESVLPVFMTFSARTSANQTQDLLDSKMDKRRKGVFGPPSGKKYCICVDDLNMPMREKYFAQPPIELMRQWMDHEGWFERKPPCAFRQIIDIQFIGCMGPPGGGRNPVTNRLLRHFNFLAFTDMSDESTTRIFETILGASLSRSFTSDIQELCHSITVATVAIYNTVRTDLLPTPAKSHYTFNLRDLARVFQGMLRAEPKLIGRDKKEYLQLWLHENSRVFSDRLINNEDRDWFKNMVGKQLEAAIGMTYDEVSPSTRLLYGDYLVPGADPRIYQRVTDLPQLQKVIEESLEDYNTVSNAPMKLVLFLDAIEHVSRICRVIRLPLGNALLLGVGGSGRQSLTRLATYLQDFTMFQIEVAKGYGKNEWRDDLKKVLLLAGAEGKDTVFLFTDTQIVMESFLEDINNILNSGEVPNLWKVEDLETIANAIRPILQAEGIAPTKLAISNLFVQRVRSNMHIVLAMSPIGDAFRQRLRMFPSLVNCCTIDWFSEWPDEALNSVANTFLADVNLSSAELTASVVKACVFIHQSVEKKSKTFYDELRRFNYVTPTSYLELLGTFIRLLREKRENLEMQRKRLQIGLDKLNTTASEVAVMEVELQNLQPVLTKTQQEVESMMIVIKADTEEADKTKKIVSKQEADANTKAAEAKAIADDAQADLDKALPALDAALVSLKNLSRNDIVEVKALKNPPAGVRLVMEACCVMFQLKPKMVNDPSPTAKPGAKIADYWEASTKILADPTAFLDSLMTYDKENIPAAVIKQIEPYIGRDDFTPDAISKVSKACTSICMWARAMYTYYQVAVSVEPKRQKLAGAQAELDQTMKELATSQAELKRVQDKLATLDKQFQEANQKKKDLAAQVQRCEQQLERAGKLIGGLGGEKKRWEQTVQQLTNDLENVVGDVVIAAGAVAYSGPFTPVYRHELSHSWMHQLKLLEVPHTPNTSLTRTLADPVQIRAWNIAGLPSDAVSTENGIIVSKARRWPLCIDPQVQANKWIKNMEKDAGIDVIKLSEKDYLRTLANGIRFGRAVLLENIGETLDAALEPLLQKQTFKQGGSEVIKMGEDIIPYHPDFRFYMTTKFRNPHYAPEVSVKVSLLNFFVTLDGLEDQLLGKVVGQERSDLSELKNQLVISNAKAKKELKDIEDKILHLLSTSQGNILDDEVLINTLAASKVTSNEIAAKVAEAEQTEKTIDDTRELYRPVATRASLLFFCISDLAAVDPMYQYSLSWFIMLFIRSIDDAEKNEDVAKRVQILNDYFTYALYLMICRSLFESHKLMFSLLLCTAIMKNQNRLDPLEWRFWLAGPTDTSISEPNPAPEWVTEKVWVEILNVSKLANFQGFAKSFSESVEHYRQYFESADPHTFPLAGEWNDKLSVFQKLLILRCIRPDKVMLGVTDFATVELGQRFVEPPPFDLEACYKEASPSTPLIFVLSAGADPMADLLKLCEEMKMLKRFDQVSLGQGQGPKAEKLISQAMDRGMWICLQNCHLAQSWMPKLEIIVENIQPDKVHKDFRLWLTAMPSPFFPVAVLQNGVKMTLEPPKGLKSNLIRSFSRINDKYIEECTKTDMFRKMLYSICLFHAVIQDRRKFGPLGWNIRYEFTDGDLNMCQTQIKMLMNEYETIPYRVIIVLCGEVNYGGRVTDDKDRRLMNNLLEKFVCPGVVSADYKFSPSGTYISPNASSVSELMDMIKLLPLNPKPEIFGLHENADITCDQNETYAMFETVLSLQPRVSSGSGLSREDVIEATTKDILSKCPKPFDIDIVLHRYPTKYEQSMNTVLTQECIRYNGLLTVMGKSLQESLKALKGLVVMSPELEAVTNSIFNNQVPEMWATKAYPSLKPLSSWVVDLLERIRFIADWIEHGPPPCFWISGFFFPQAFLTGTLQNYARKNQYPIDTIAFDFILEDSKTIETTKEGPQDGCYIHGFFLEGARWDYTSHMLDESRPKELFTEMPIMWLKPTQHRVAPTSGVYDCPVYKTLTRAGTLSTTGHSTNFVLFIEIPTDKMQEHWINRGVACFTSLMF